MAYVTIPKDLTKVKSKVLFGLTRRQLICFGAAVLVGVPLFFLLKDAVDSSTATLCMILVMLPFFLFAMFERHGQPLEVIIQQMVQTMFVRPKVRPYQTHNFYTAVQQQINLETVMLTGVLDVFPQGLFQRRNTGQILGIQGDIIEPAFAAIFCIGAVNGGHGDGYQEGVSGGSDHFGNLGFHQQIQTQLQIVRLGLAVGIGQGHCSTAICSNVVFHSGFNGGGIGFQTGCQSIDQHIGLIEILVFVQVVCIGIPLGTIFQTQGLQEVSTLYLVDTVQNLHMVVGAVISGGFGKLDDIRNPQIGKFLALDGLAVADFSIAQIRLVIIVTSPDSATQNVFDTFFVIAAGGHIGAVPDTVLFGVRNIVLVDGKRTGAALVNEDIFGRIRGCHSGGADGEGQDQHERKTQSDCFFEVFHIAIFVPFIF